MKEMQETYRRIRKALEVLTEWNDSFWGLGGATGDADDEQLGALNSIATILENIVVEYGLE